jgi:SAM-dependent methyltransferase
VATHPQSFADRVAWSAEHTVAPLIARAKLIGLPSGATRALEFPCGVGATTAAMAHSLGEAVGIDPSATSIESAAIMHRGDARCAFVTGGLEAVDALDGKFDFAYADLRGSRRGNRPGTVAAALLRALAPGGMVVVSLQPPTGRSRLLAVVRPSRHPINAVRTAITAAGGRIAWIGRGEGDSVLLYAAAPPRLLHLVEDSRPKVGLADNAPCSKRSVEQYSPT